MVWIAWQLQRSGSAAPRSGGTARRPAQQAVPPNPIGRLAAAANPAIF